MRGLKYPAVDIKFNFPKIFVENSVEFSKLEGAQVRPRTSHFSTYNLGFFFMRGTGNP